MLPLELLAPARNADIGIAAVDCGTDAVYIAAGKFGARKDAGNDLADVARLCAYAHRFGVKIFLTVNTVLSDDEIDQAHALMLEAQQAGVDAFIIRDLRLCAFPDIRVPLHASTQCAIRDVETARRYEAAGCTRIVLERQLSLDQIREIASAVHCEIECFVHGALCVGYSGECRLSEYLDGRSADRGECIQACRSLYDLEDERGRVLVRGKALLSLKDFNLKSRLEELADAGVCSFKIEGRLKNASYVKNVVRDYSLALDALVARRPDAFCRASWGVVEGGFTPDTNKTFNRGYTDLFLDGRRGRWSSMDAPKSMGEAIGTVAHLRRDPGRGMQFSVLPLRRGLELHNGDGFAIPVADGVTGFRGDVCEGLQVRCKDVPDLRDGMTLYRNINTAFEKVLETQACHREIPVSLSVRVHGKYVLELTARTQDGREVVSPFHADVETAQNRERAEAMLREQLGKRSGVYHFSVDDLVVQTAEGSLPLLSASTINGIRRLIAEDLDSLFSAGGSGLVPVGLKNSSSLRCGNALPEQPTASGEQDYSSSSHCGLAPERPFRSEARTNPLAFQGHPAVANQELLRSKYCVRYELGMCPRWQGAAASGPLFLVNNGRRFALHFDCAACEMSLTPAQN